ncbi:MAG TPA: signal peptidase II [Caulobacteraceae bacterium]
MSLATRAGTLAYGFAAAVIILDQAIKSWVVNGLRLLVGEPHSVWGPLRLTLVENRGVSFGLFQSDAPWTRWALAAFSLAVAVALAVWVRRAAKNYTGLALGLIIGGAVGNFIDRVRDGSVIDFVDVTALHFPWVFNLADSAITIGILLLIAEGFLAPKADGS